MNCYHCGSKLGAGNICIRCGAKVGAYKKIIKTSNGYYNMGLEQAKIRDLSGAVCSLKRSLQFNKNNIDARNLLGLVYYEMGEIVSAMIEWVLSKNLQPKDNVADEYLDYLQSNKGRLENVDQAAKKYNNALKLAREGSEDLAVLQLLKVIKLNPKMIRAYQLLTLLYMHANDYEKAKESIKEALSIDKTNTVALRYLDEIRLVAGKGKSKRAGLPKKTGIRMEDDSIVPTYREDTGMFRTVLYVLGGLILGAAICWWVVFPSVSKDIARQYDESIMTYGNKLSSKDAEILNLQGQITTLEEEKTTLQTQLNSYSGADGILTTYDDMLQVLKFRTEGNYLEAVARFAAVDPTKITSMTFQAIYQEMKADMETNGLQNLFASGRTAYDKRNFEQSRDYFSKCLELKPDYPDAIYWLALSYHNMGDKATADTYYTRLIEEYPGTNWATSAQGYLEQ